MYIIIINDRRVTHNRWNATSQKNYKKCLYLQLHGATIPENLTVAQLVKRILAFYGTQTFGTAFTTTNFWSMPVRHRVHNNKLLVNARGQMRTPHNLTPHSLIISFGFIFPSKLTKFPSGPHPLYFATKILNTFLFASCVLQVSLITYS